MGPEILIVDDDTRLSSMLSDYLTNAGFSVRTSASGHAGLADFTRQPPAAVILDIMLPDLDGFEVCKRLRAMSTVPILMLTAKGEETDRIVGLELGADDYLPKPFSPRELLARLKAVLRRSNPAQQQDAPSTLRFGQLEIEPESRIARIDGQDCPLTSYQFDLLVVLAKSAGRVLSRDQLLDQVKGMELEAFDRSIDVHISRIRAAIETDPKNPRRIITVRGAGYVFAKHQDPDNG